MPRRGIRWWRVTILVLAGVFFLAPLGSAIDFALQGDHGGTSLANFGAFITNGGVRAALITSLEIGGLTMVIVLALMIPTVVFVRLRMPRLTLVLESVTILPIVIPPVVMAAGLLTMESGAGSFLQNDVFASPLTGLTPFYVVLAMPFTYRSLDTGVRAIDLRTLVDAARGLGASWSRVILSVVLPNIRTAVLGAAFLTLALVLGEVVISRILSYTTFPVQIIAIGDQGNAGVPVALSVESLVFTWGMLLVISFLGGRTSGGRRGRIRRPPVPGGIGGGLS
jgi:putative spermidine/putrescine transport system permease protein